MVLEQCLTHITNRRMAIFIACVILVACLTTTAFADVVERIPITDPPIFREPPLPRPKSLTRAVEMQFVDQYIDNFNPQKSDTFKMRFLRNDQFFQPGGPIFIYIGGEWAISSGWIRGGHMYDMAKMHNAQMFYTEHRYYGQSHPTQNATTENFKYLNVEQALADLAHFIAHVKREPGKEDSKVVMIGASYAASMAAWFRQKYPHLVVGAWASSAPLNITIDMYEYKVVVGAAVREIGGERCINRVHRGIRAAEQLVEQGHFDRLKSVFRLCNFDVQRKENIWRFFSSLGGTLSGTVQYHRDNDIQRVCANILNDTRNGTDLEEFARWYLTGRVDPNNPTECLDINYENMVEYYRKVQWGQGATQDSRPWMYQTCSEYGWYQTSTSPNQPFGSHFPVAYNLQYCEDIFGKEHVNRNKLAENTIRKNTIYGALLPGVTNVYFTHGEIDPWRTLGVQSDVGPTAPVTIIPGASHCSDLYAINELGTDSPEMLASKLKIQQLIADWLK